MRVSRVSLWLLLLGLTLAVMLIVTVTSNIQAEQERSINMTNAGIMVGSTDYWLATVIAGTVTAKSLSKTPIP
jgi:hypothetical protein